MEECDGKVRELDSRIKASAIFGDGHDSVAALEFDATWPVPPGTALCTALMKARRQSSLKLRIYVDSVKKGGKATPLGTAEVDLSKSIDGLRDVEDEESELPTLSLDKSPQVR